MKKAAWANWSIGFTWFQVRVLLKVNTVVLFLDNYTINNVYYWQLLHVQFSMNHWRCKEIEIVQNCMEQWLAWKYAQASHGGYSTKITFASKVRLFERVWFPCIANGMTESRTTKTTGNSNRSCNFIWIGIELCK